MLREGLQHARIDALVGAPPVPPGLPGDEAPAAPRTFWSALFSQPSQLARHRRRSSDAGDEGAGDARRVAS